MDLDDIEEQGELLLVDIPKNKTDNPRKFTITAELAQVVKKYINLRPQNTPSKCRFFIRYEKNTCVKVSMGKSKISAVPKEVASWLSLPNPERFTGHALRRTSATLLSNEGGTMMDVKHLGGRESDKIAQRYIDNSALNNKKIANIVSKSIHPSSTITSKDEQAPFNNLNFNAATTSNQFDVQVDTSGSDSSDTTNISFSKISCNKRVCTKTSEHSKQIGRASCRERV